MTTTDGTLDVNGQGRMYGRGGCIDASMCVPNGELERTTTCRGLLNRRREEVQEEVDGPFEEPAFGGA